ncbi:AfsR/SARP family transcriptional regulator [Amycolatopsis nigrescens]|uniref:AfsR/SARP family transcriptional regulator n=1 Tax=Amycolatopsis nigrescens TaxID=381445 RepID=UPI00037BE295|nr:BTAD domain-containing putative transcriptional regulator [Amycolatopsis nigrescens]
MLFHVLGPLEARGPEGAVLEFGARKPATVLATLLLNPNSWAGLGRLVEATWHEQVVPASAEANLKTYVWRLRRTLPALPGGTRIESRPGAYRVRVAPGELDAEWVTGQAAAARRALGRGDHAVALTLLEEALALWRGRPFEGLPRELVSDAVLRLDHLHRDLQEGLAEAQLSLGHRLDATATLRALTAQDPLRESAWALLVRSLREQGRRVEALDAYRRARTVLADELGVDPGAALAEAHRRLLAGDASARALAGRSRRELPREVAGLVGRGGELDLMYRAPRGATMVLDGMTGVGKTALAVHAAHRLSARFPDGQFFVDLRAHAETGPLDPGEALTRLLRGIGVDPRSVPADVDERSALWRSELSRRRVLLVLDDAADDRQVRPLLPGAATSLTLITTRNRGWRLEGEQRVALATLDDTAASALFRAAAEDARRVAATPADTAAVVRACGGLPGALHTAAARLRSRPSWTVARLVEWIAEQPGRLLGPGAPAPAVAGSYQQLTPAEREAFHALGVLPEEFDGRLAAERTGGAQPEILRLLENLVDRHLLEAPAIDRYRTHPLVREQARLAAASAASRGPRALPGARVA